MKLLNSVGWNSFFEKQFEKYKLSGFKAGRIINEQKERYIVFTEYGNYQGEISGKLLYSTDNNSDFPKVGDWVAVSIFKEESKVVIHEILKRKNKFSRQAAGQKTEEQVIAANIDAVFIMQSQDQNYNVKRMERYISMIYEMKAEPVILLNKSDLAVDPQEKLVEIRKIFPGIISFSLSSIYNIGIEQVKEIIQPGKTYMLIGSSGVGKSTIINHLAGEDILKTNDVREKDSKGKHTTTSRQMIILENGGLLIDTPGMRGFKLWNTESGLEETFNEIDNFAGECRFADCTHTSEIKCAVIDAVKSGKISKERYESYLKLQKELRYLETKQNKFSYLESKKRMKTMKKAAKNYFKNKF
ncbi:MAG: ribosome small subunit-dependent GTPase A [Ignavibacteriaceae bacterium]